MSLEQQVQRLVDIDAIKALKARYFRCIDMKLWDELGEVFDADVVAEYSGPGPRIAGRAAVVEFIRSAVHAVRTVHHGHMPEIEVTGDTARGIWAMFDMVERADGSGAVMRGYGHYHEDYVRTAVGWKIRTLRLTRLRVDRRVPP